MPVAPQGPQVATRAGVFVLAGWWLRFGGYLIDAIILDVPLLVVGGFIGFADVETQASISEGHVVLSTGAEVLIVAISVVAVIGYPLLMLRLRGQTLGMMAVGVRAVDSASGLPLSTRQTWARVLTFFALGQLWIQVATVITFADTTQTRPVASTVLRLLAFAGLLTTGLWATGNALNQTLQDKAAGTVVIRVRP